MKSVLLILVGASLFILAPFSRTLAHCDGLDGPVVQAAQKAIATGDVNLVLIWVQKRDEDEGQKNIQRDNCGAEAQSGGTPTR